MTEHSSPQVVLFGGKGGVGKTTCASATAVALASRDVRTLLVSTDPAHSTSDVFDVDIGDQPTAIDDGLHAVEIVPADRFRRRYSDKLEQLLERASSLGIGIDENDVSDVAENGLVPGADELAVIDVFAEYVEDTAWDVVVFDTAPTGHTLRVLQLPDVAGSALSKIAKIKSGLDRMGAAAARLFGNDSSEDDLNLGDDVTKAQTRIETVAEIFKDEDRTRFNIVTHPEQMALAETDRLRGKLHDADVPVGETLVNKVRLDINDDCEYCVAQQTKQQALLEEFETEMGVEMHRIPATPAMSDRERVDAIATEIPVSATVPRLD